MGERLKEAFGTERLQTIAEQVGMSYQGLDHLIKGRRKLTDEFLVHVSSLTNCSIHWLVAGEGPKEVMHVDHLVPKGKAVSELSPEVRTAIRREIIDVLGGLLLSGRDREIADTLLADLRSKIEKGKT